MTDWKSYVEDFYRRDDREQARLWSELSPEQRDRFQAERDAMKSPRTVVDTSQVTLTEEMEELIRIGKELKPSDIGAVLWGSSGKRHHEFTAWRLRCLGVLRELGSSAEHLLPTVENKLTETAYKQSVQRILGAMVAARNITERTEPSTRARTTVEGAGSVFVVHGHDHAALQQMARLIEKLGLRPIVLFEEASRGRTIIEKLEEHSGASAAVVLLTPDDIGAPAGDPQRTMPRARQNVILELGYFLGSLGRQRVVVMYTDGVELPSDYAGVEYIKFDSAGAWRLRVARELRAAELDVDLNKLE